MSVLGVGALFFLIDPDAELAVTMCNRPMTEAEWEQYRTSQAAVRKRRIRSRSEQLEVDLQQDDRQYAGART